MKKIWSQEEIKELLENNNKMVIKSLFKLYELQTHEEKLYAETVESNGMGFNCIDAPFLIKIVEWYETKGFLTTKQMFAVRKKLKKYAGQLTRIANIANEV